MVAGAELVALYEASDDDNDDAKALQRAKYILESGDDICCLQLRPAKDSLVVHKSTATTTTTTTGTRKKKEEKEDEHDDDAEDVCRE
jgi:hypothetical protein